MLYVRIIDEQGFFLEDGFVEDLTEFTIETPCPAGFYRPKWNGEKWVEGLTQEEIAELTKPVPQEPTVEERLQMAEDTIMFMLMGGM